MRHSENKMITDKRSQDSEKVTMQTISARKTRVREVSLETAQAFVEENHRAGWAIPGKAAEAFGLYFGQDLLAVAIFCNPRTSRKQRQYTTELFRLAFKKNVRVQGGASKLLTYYMKLDTTVDLFTYQDTSGKRTSVYEHCGMTLVGSKNPKKKVLVIDGKTFSEAENNRKDWFSIEQAVKLGPDSLIGTGFGEVLEVGKRVSNIELFKRAGYHLEEIPGDRLYEWRNPKFKFYTYKISSTVDDNYYFGRHKTTLETEAEMTSDGYMGSGGAKFKNWIKSIPPEALRKELVGVYKTWEDVGKAERELIGDLAKTDPNCKNSMVGGAVPGGSLPDYTMAICEVHGKTKFRGGCHKCAVGKSHALVECEIHGLSKHYGGSCLKCVNSKRFNTENCPVHGVTTFSGKTCLSCSFSESIELKNCELHGMVKHQGKRCFTCNSEKSVSVKKCNIHGEVKHVGDHCKKCLSDNATSTKECKLHGLTLFIGEQCRKCSSSNAWVIEFCSIHGESSHRSGNCESCAQKARVTIENCNIHGDCSHISGKCLKCKTQRQVTTKVCPTHGETKFNGDTCCKCLVRKVWTVEKCEVHGETKHRSGKCEKCRALANWAKRKARETTEANK
jgi:hypothetical protein